MKVIGIYSGKGGVGKSTITTLLGAALAQKYKVAILDMDVNTPSMPIMIKEPKTKNLEVFSSGYTVKNPMYTGVQLRRYLKGQREKIVAGAFDICLLDMPPSITDTHLTLCGDFKVGSTILVSQPNNLCLSDIAKGYTLLDNAGIEIVGVIENMVSSVFGESKEIKYFNLPVLGRIKLKKEISNKGANGELLTLKPNPLNKIALQLYANTPKTDWNETIEGKEKNWEGDSLKMILSQIGDTINAPDRASILKHILKFRGLSSWEKISSMLAEDMLVYDNFLLYNDTATIRRMLEAFNNDDTALFMVTRPPTTEIHLLRGELGYARLKLDSQSHYGMPRVVYGTDEGEVTLFPHEVSAYTEENMQKMIDIGELTRVFKSNKIRYIPPSHILQMIDNQFGMRAGWKEEIRRLGLIER